ncbi:MAG TPA: MFS transporter [Stellaceae bacterium]|nr:MFS transporter [Stellaceae bacterium]
MIRSTLRQMVVGLGATLVWLDFAVNVAFPDMVRRFDLAIGDVQWVVICYVLTYTSLMLIVGRVGDMFGHARVFRFGLLWSTAALICCALAPSFPLLLIGRFLLGIGAALVLSCGPALATSLESEDRRSRVLGVYTMMMALGATLGPVLGGLVSAEWGWPAVFWFRVPVALAALAALGPIALPRRVATAGRFDAAGALLLALSLIAVVLALNRLPSVTAWPLALLALALLAGFIRHELRTAAPIIDLSVFRIPGFALVNGASVLTNLAAFAVWLLVPFYLTETRGLGLAESGILLAAASLGAVVAGPGAGRLARWITPRYLAIVGAAMVGAGLALIARWEQNTVTSALLGALFLQGLGLGVFQLAYLDIVTATIPRDARGVAGSLAMVARTLGTVSAASIVMLLFRSFAAESDFLSAFRQTFALATALAFAMAVLLAWRGRPRRPTPSPHR